MERILSFRLQNMKYEVNGCIGPVAFIKLAEKYVVLLILFHKQCRDVVIPSDLAMDVLCRYNDTYADAIDKFRAVHAPYHDEQKRCIQQLLVWFIEAMFVVLNLNNLNLEWFDIDYHEEDIVFCVEVFVARMVIVRY